MTREGDDVYACSSIINDASATTSGHGQQLSGLQQSYAPAPAQGVIPSSSSSSSSQQPLHLQLQQPPNPSMADGNNNNYNSIISSNSNNPERLSSLIYDRTIKIHKTNYSDHGSHGVAAYPLLHQHVVTNSYNNTVGQVMLGGGGPDVGGGGGGAGAAATTMTGIQGNAIGGAIRGGSSLSGYSLPSSVQMQLQMQQMTNSAGTASAALHSQQHHLSSLPLPLPLQNGLPQSMTTQQQQQQRPEFQLMPPPPPTSNNASSMGSFGNPMHQFFLNNHGNNNLSSSVLSSSSIRTGGAAGGGQLYSSVSGLTNTMNATSSTELMEAFNAQIAANHAAINSITNAVALSANAVAGAGATGLGNGLLHNYLVPQQQPNNPMMVGLGNFNSSFSTQPFDAGQLLSGNSTNMGSSSSSTMSVNNYNPPLVAPSMGGGYINYNNPDDIAIAPHVVDFRNGKKRTSPSIPLHPSQLQFYTTGGGVGGNSLCNSTGSLAVGNSSMGMNSVAEEGEENALLGTGNMQVNSSTVDAHLMLLQQNQQTLIQPHQSNISNATIGGAKNQGAASQHHGPMHVAYDSGSPQSGEPAFGEKSQPQQIQPDNADETSRANFMFSPSSFGDPTANAFHANEIIQGEVLTNPSIPSSNAGLDNSEGNLIVRRGDIFRIPKAIIHCHPPSAAGKPARNRSSSSRSRLSDDDYVEYKVVSLLGQGTFAQVFHCIDQTSEKAVAVKIVKNKPAYTRQAAVEIDVFRKLNAPLAGEERSEDTSDGQDSPAAGGEGETNVSATVAQDQNSIAEGGFSLSASTTATSSDKSIIRLMCYFMHCSHLCLVFEMLGPNLYEILKKRQFRGLPIEAVRALVRQAAEGIQLLGTRNVVHCDLKPENILMVRSDVDSVIAECKKMGTVETKEDLGRVPDKDLISKPTQSNPDKPGSDEANSQWIKLIDFGSACFEGQTTHTYIQSRFYRSPEVLIGLPYDSAIDIWSLGCVAAELFLGLPILPGVHEHDQLGRILEMVGPLPDWMVEQGSKSGKFFKHAFPSDDSTQSEWLFMTRQEYINVLTEEEKRSKGGLTKLEQQQTNRYFKKKRLEDIVMHHGVCNTQKDREQLGLFVHFLKGLLHPDPWKRWTAHQVLNHPFLSGNSVYRMKASTGGVDVDGTRLGVRPYDILWVPPWDASISKRKLIVIQKAKEKEAQQAQVSNNSRACRRVSGADLPGGGSRMPISQSVPEARAMVPNAQLSRFSAQGSQMLYDPPHRIQTMLPPQTDLSDKSSPTKAFAHGGPPIYTLPAALSSSLGGVAMPLNFQQLTDIGAVNPYRTSVAGRSFSDSIHSVQMSAQQQQLHASLSELYDAALLQSPPSHPPIMGAQSFSGIYYQGMPRSHYPHVESDLGYALQRPGVVPGMGSDAFASLRRQSSQLSFNSAALFTQPSQMLSPSLSTLSSPTPRNHFAPPGLNSNYQAVSMSPGGLLLQKLGLQDQLFANQSNTAGSGISLLSQQLEEYSHPDQQQGQYISSRQNQYKMPGSLQSASTSAINPGSYRGGDVISRAVPTVHQFLPFDTQQCASFTDLNGGMHRTHTIFENVNLGAHDDAPAPMSFPSIAYTRPHASSFSDFGNNMIPNSSLPFVLQNNGFDESYSTDDPSVEQQKRPSMG
jgi:dual specificity protein kinase YAK1